MKELNKIETIEIKNWKSASEREIWKKYVCFQHEETIHGLKVSIEHDGYHFSKSTIFNMETGKEYNLEDLESVKELFSELNIPYKEKSNEMLTIGEYVKNQGYTCGYIIGNVDNATIASTHYKGLKEYPDENEFAFGVIWGKDVTFEELKTIYERHNLCQEECKSFGVTKDIKNKIIDVNIKDFYDYEDRYSPKKNINEIIKAETFKDYLYQNFEEKDKTDFFAWAIENDYVSTKEVINYLKENKYSLDKTSENILSSIKETINKRCKDFEIPISCEQLLDLQKIPSKAYKESILKNTNVSSKNLLAGLTTEQIEFCQTASKFGFLSKKEINDFFKENSDVNKNFYNFVNYVDKEIIKMENNSDKYINNFQHSIIDSLYSINKNLSEENKLSNKEIENYLYFSPRALSIEEEKENIRLIMEYKHDLFNSPIDMFNSEKPLILNNEIHNLYSYIYKQNSNVGSKECVEKVQDSIIKFIGESRFKDFLIDNIKECELNNLANFLENNKSLNFTGSSIYNIMQDQQSYNSAFRKPINAASKTIEQDTSNKLSKVKSELLLKGNLIATNIKNHDRD